MSGKKRKQKQYSDSGLYIILTVMLMIIIVLFLLIISLLKKRNAVSPVSAVSQPAEILSAKTESPQTQASEYVTESPEIQEFSGIQETMTETEISETEPEFTEAPETMPVPVVSKTEEILRNMTLEEKVYQLFIVTPEAVTDDAVSCITQAGALFSDCLKNKPVGGVILFSQNLETEEQTRTLISNMQECAASSAHAGLWIAVDEEGGLVSRVSKRLGTTAYEPMAVYGADADTDYIYQVGADISADIAQYGFNLDFAPVADVSINPGNELGSRIFSSNPEIVSDMTASIVRGLQESGKVSATLKHFPGLGAEDGNTHYDTTAYISRTFEELQNCEFKAFQGGIAAGADFVMVGHQIMSCAGDNLPSDMSSVVISSWLREELHFEGIVVTDAQNMNTISGSYTSGEAAVQSIQAGADIILMPVSLNDAFASVCRAVYDGTISESRIDESVSRILEAKSRHGLLPESES